jgi:hypothetical protein
MQGKSQGRKKRVQARDERAEGKISLFKLLCCLRLPNGLYQAEFYVREKQ